MFLKYLSILPVVKFTLLSLKFLFMKVQFELHMVVLSRCNRYQAGGDQNRLLQMQIVVIVMLSLFPVMCVTLKTTVKQLILLVMSQSGDGLVLVTTYWILVLLRVALAPAAPRTSKPGTGSWSARSATTASVPSVWMQALWCPLASPARLCSSLCLILPTCFWHTFNLMIGRVLALTSSLSLTSLLS